MLCSKRTTRFLGRILVCGVLCFSAQLQSQTYDELIQTAMQLRNQGDFAAAETTLTQALAIAQNQSEVRYLLGMVLAFQQRFDEAHEQLDMGLQSRPQDFNLRLGKARVFSFQSRYSQAEEILSRLRAEQPENTEAINLSGRLALYQQQSARALDYFERALALEPDNSESRLGQRDALAAAGSSNEIIVGAGVSRFDTNNFSNWRDRSVTYRRASGLNNTVFLRVADTHRFGDRDYLFQAGLQRHREGGLPWQISMGFSPDENFSAGYSLGASATFRINEGGQRIGTTLVTPNLQVSDYTTGTVWRLGADFEHYIRGADAWVTPGLGWVRDERGGMTFSWSLGAHWQLSERLRAGVGFADGAETENKITTQTRNRNAYLRWQFADRWYTLVSLARDERRQSYARETLSISLGVSY